MTTYPQYFTNNGVGCISVDGLVRCGLGELGIDLVKDPDTAPEAFLLRTTDMAVEYSFGGDVSTTSLADIGTLGTRLSSVVAPPDATTLQVEDAIQIEGTANSIILSASAGLNQLLLDDDAGTEGYVLTSGGADGSLTWSAGGGGATPSLAEVLAVEPNGNIGNPNQNIQLSREVDETHPFGIQVFLNGGDGRISTGYNLTAEDTHLIEASLYPDQLFFINENDTNPAVKNTQESRLFADELSITSQTGDPEVIQFDSVSLTTSSLTFNAQLGEADPIGISLDANKIGLVSGGNTDYGTAGQVLTSGGSAGTLTWTDVVVSTPSLAEVLAVAPEGAGNDDQSIYLSRTPDETNINGIQTQLNGADGKIQLSTQLTEVASEKFKDMSITFNGTILTSEDNTNPSASVIETSRQLVDEFRINSQVPQGGNTLYKEASLTPSVFHLTAQLNETDPDGIYIDPLKIGLETGGVINYGTAGQVLTSGGSGGQLTWSDVAVPALASVLAVAPEGEGNEGQIITLSKEAFSYVGDGTNVISGSGMVMDFQGVEIASNLRYVNEVLPHYIYIKTFDSSEFPPIDDQPEYETFVESGYMTLTQTKNVEDVATTDYLVLEPTRIGLSVANGATDYGTAGEVLTSGGENGTLSWTKQDLNAVLTSGNESTEDIVLRVNPTDEDGNKAVFSPSSGSYLTYDNFVVVNETLADSGKLQITTGNPTTTGSQTKIESNNFYIKNATQYTNITPNTISMLNGHPVAPRNYISIDSVECFFTAESVQTGVDKLGRLGLDNLTIADNIANEVSTLSTTNLSIISGDLNTTFTEVSLDSSTLTMLVKNQGVGVVRQTEITQTAVKVYESLALGQENYISVEAKQIGIGVDGAVDYGEAGQVLTSGGAGGVLSWADGGAGTTPSLADVLDISPEGVANADQTITLSTSTDTNVVSGTGVAISTATESSTLTKEDLTITGSSISTGSQISTLTKDTLTMTSGALETTLKEVSLGTIDNSVYVKEQSSVGGLAQTTILPTQVKVLSNSFQEQFVAIEPTQIGIGVAGVIDYGDAGQVLTSGGGLGGLSWTTPSGTPSLDAVLNVAPAGEATADLSITFKETESPFLTTRFDIDGINSTRPSLELQNDTLINIGTDDNGANTITIGHTSATTANYSPVNVNGKFSINGVLFSGADGGTTQLGVASYTIPQDALRNSLYTLIIAGTATPTPLNFPTDDTGGKYITIFNAGSQSIRCQCSASPVRPFVGGNNGLAGGSTYAIRANQTVQFLSAGSQGFLLFAQSNPNSNVGTYPFPVQSLTTNQRVIATTITGASVNGTFTYTSITGQTNFSSPASVQLTAQDATGTQTMILRTNTVSGFTYVSSSGVFPTTLHIYALGV